MSNTPLEGGHSVCEPGKRAFRFPRPKSKLNTRPFLWAEPKAIAGRFYHVLSRNDSPLSQGKLGVDRTRPVLAVPPGKIKPGTHFQRVQVMEKRDWWLWEEVVWEHLGQNETRVSTNNPEKQERVRIQRPYGKGKDEHGLQRVIHTPRLSSLS